MFEDPYFSDLIKITISVIMNNNLSSILSKIDGFEELYFKISKERTFEIWAYSFKIRMFGRSCLEYDTHHEYVEYLKDLD